MAERHAAVIAAALLAACAPDAGEQLETDAGDPITLDTPVVAPAVGRDTLNAPSTDTSRASVAPPRDPDIAPDSLAHAMLVDVQQVDGTILVDARYAGADNFTAAPLPGYRANRALLRREAAAALARAQASLREDGFGLLVWDGYRPARATAAMVAWAERTGRGDLLNGWIGRRSRHNMGLAVDVTLVELASGRPVDMGTDFDTFSPEAHTARASGEVARNRQRLVRALEAEGFSNYFREWWHFDFRAPRPLRFDVPVE